MKELLRKNLALVDALLVSFVYPAALIMWKIRAIGLHHLPLCKKSLLRIGVLPIRDHYYEPLFNPKHLTRPLSEERNLPGIDWNVQEQLALLDSFEWGDELGDIPSTNSGKLEFYMDNGYFTSGDAEYWYQLIRDKKPRQIIEIGSGYSSLMAARAIKRNSEEDLAYTCQHICIEPYETPWLEQIGVEVIRQRVEEVGQDYFSRLGENDILFIDSSHIIRPQGDVVFEYLQLLPSLNEGVIVHVHDIFSPRDYLSQWVENELRLWNEQYLLEAFLTSNRDWKIIGALNHLHHRYYGKLKAKCPFLTREREPASFYLQKIA